MTQHTASGIDFLYSQLFRFDHGFFADGHGAGQRVKDAQANHAVVAPLIPQPACKEASQDQRQCQPG
jgi:hypothetical protein